MPHYAPLLVAAKVTAKVHHYTVIDLPERLPQASIFNYKGGITQLWQML
jgi:hypothetical protein